MTASDSTPTVAPTVVAALGFLRRYKILAVDSFMPECVRRFYQELIAVLFTCRTAYVALPVTALFAAAEYEQPGYFPRTQELTVGLIGFLGAFALIFSTYALMEYADDHTWFWNEEGFVWPWEAILWSLTVYDDEMLGDRVTVHNDTSITTSPTVGSTTPVGSPAQPDIIIPPTPLLPGGLRPVYLPPPLTHHSGILGESPMPIKFKHSSGNSDLEIVDEE